MIYISDRSKRIYSAILFITLVMFICSIISAFAAKEQGILITNGNHRINFRTTDVQVFGNDNFHQIIFRNNNIVSPDIKYNGIVKKGVKYNDLWSGINVNFDIKEKGIVESIWEIRAGANINHIRFSYNSPANIEADGKILILHSTGWMEESRPIAWQTINGIKKMVDVNFHDYGEYFGSQNIGFIVGKYDSNYPLFIDPVLTWHTFAGSSGEDLTKPSFAVSANGDLIAVGKSDTTWGSPLNEHTGNNDLFLVRLKSTGERVWNTFLNTGESVSGFEVTADSNSNIYVTGSSKSTWGSPKTPHTIGTNDDAFIAKFDAEGRLLWNTFFGSSDWDHGESIRADIDGNIYVVGTSSSEWGAPNSYSGCGGGVFAAKFDADGNFIWNTIMGGDSYSCTARGKAVAVGSKGIYITGVSGSDSWGTPIIPLNYSDVFVVKLDLNSGVLRWNTFLGNFDYDDCGDIDVDQYDNVYVAGTSIDAWGTPINSFETGYNTYYAFAAKLDFEGNLTWNTFFGSRDNTVTGESITMDNVGNVYVGGFSARNVWQRYGLSPGNHNHSYIIKLASNGHSFWSAVLMGRGVDIEFGDKNLLYASGQSNLNVGQPIFPYSGGTDMFVARLTTNGCAFYQITTKNGVPFYICL